MSLKNLNLDSIKDKSVLCLNEPLVKVTRAEETYQHVFIGNIPLALKTSDLRIYFKEFVEKGAFKLFHYRHRPETNAVRPESNTETLVHTESKSNVEESKTCCCITQVFDEYVYDLIDSFHKSSWRKNHTLLNTIANIKLLKVKSIRDDALAFQSKVELKSNKHENDQEIYQDELKKLIELNPPAEVMPNGNVGTTTKYFLKMISECKMPTSVLKRLGIEFPKSAKKKAYSNVQMNYENFANHSRNFRSNKDKNISEMVKPHDKYLLKKPSDPLKPENEATDKNSDIKFTADNETNAQNKNEYFGKVKTQVYKKGKNFTKSGCSKLANSRNKTGDNENESLLNNDDLSDDEKETEDHDAEDWERYEALHDDIDNQSRPKERLFEEDIEVKWEKGGSGLVFYTDSFFWNELKGKDFDEDTVDDWDVDYSVYYEDGAGDKSARDQLDMRIQQRRRAGLKDGPVKYSDLRRRTKINKRKMNNFGEFEKYSKAYGSKILKKHGWEEGKGLGSWKEGITEPVNLNGRASREAKIGLGYYGDKLDRTVSLQRPAEKEVYISTIYDDKEGEQMDALRFRGLEMLKYRTPKIKFDKEEQNNDSIKSVSK